MLYVQNIWWVSPKFRTADWTDKVSAAYRMLKAWGEMSAGERGDKSEGGSGPCSQPTAKNSSSCGLFLPSFLIPCSLMRGGWIRDFF